MRTLQDVPLEAAVNISVTASAAQLSRAVPSPVLAGRGRPGSSRTLRNLFHIYYDRVDYAMILDNSGTEPRVVAEETERRMKAKDMRLLQKMRDGANAL